jgi:putative transposase
MSCSESASRVRGRPVDEQHARVLERSLGEVKRRTKVMGRFPGEDSCLTLVWAVLDLLITHETNGIRFTELDRQRLNRIRYHEPDHAIPEEVTAA